MIDSNNCVVLCRIPRSLDLFNMSAKGGVAPTSESQRPWKGGRRGTRAGYVRLEHLVDLLFEQEF